MKIVGIIFGLLILLMGSLYVILFTPMGNRIVAPMVEAKINESLPIPATLKTFALDLGSFRVVLDITDNNTVTTWGTFEILTQQINAAYQLRLDALDALQPLTQQPLQGALHLDGNVTGTPQALTVQGLSDIAQSHTIFDATLIDLSPTSLNASIQHAHVNELLHIVGQKPLLSGKLDLNARIDSFDPEALKGVATLALKEGQLNRSHFKKEMGLELPDTTFNTQADALLEGETLLYDLKVHSALATITSKGSVMPKTLALDLNYALRAKELALFSALTPIPLKGPLNLKGTVKGDQKTMHIKGTTDLAKSDSRYEITLKALQPERVIATMRHVQTEALLRMVSQAPIVSGTFNLDANLDNLNPDNLQGTFDLSMPKGTVNRSLVQKTYGLKLPKQSDFNAKVTAILKGTALDYGLNIRSAPANITSKGNVIPKTMAMALDYDLSVKELALFKTLTPIPLRGGLGTQGKVSGDKKALNVTGKATLAGGSSDYRINLKAFQPKDIQARLKGVKIQRLLHMLYQPHYADGTVDLTADFDDLRSGQLRGNVTSKISKGMVDSAVVAKQFNINPMPRTTFEATTQTQFKGDLLTTEAKVTSSLANLTSNKATFQLNNGHIKADYRVDVPNLDALYFVTEQHLKGKMTLTGQLSKTKDLDLTVHADTLGGSIDATVHNDDVQGEAKNIQTLAALEMLIYPELFKSTLQGRFNYNLANEKGTFDTQLSKGQFTQNSMLDLVRQYGRTDLYQERFNGTLKGSIAKKKIRSHVDLRSNNASIKGKNMKLDTTTKKVDAKLEVTANNNPIKVRVKGDMNRPKVDVDASKLLQRELNKTLEKEAGKLLKRLF